MKDPALIQGVGGRMSGLVSTSPISKVIRRIEKYGGIVVDKEHASLDQFAGVKWAYDVGYTKVAVTVARPEVAEKIRKDYPDAIIFGVHVTGLTQEEAESMVAVTDLMTSCASKDRAGHCRGKSTAPGRCLGTHFRAHEARKRDNP